MRLTRFAPAPTGFLHLGHVVNAIYVWGFGKVLGASVLLRIEDHDRTRSRREYEEALLDDLDWLGFIPDRHPTDELRNGRSESRQSDRETVYESDAAALANQGLVYGCTCTRRDLRSAPGAAGASVRYAGRCRDRGIGATDGVTWRVRMDSSVARSFEDLLAGADVVASAASVDLGDPVIRDRLGNWTYQFAVSVDDYRQGVDLVIRGEDLLSSTRLQIQLAAMMGRPEPARFAHHRLIMKSPTQKLSKSDGDTGIRQLRERGWTAARTIGHAAFLAGLIDDESREIDAREVCDLFRSAGPAISSRVCPV